MEVSRVHFHTFVHTVLREHYLKSRNRPPARPLQRARAHLKQSIKSSAGYRSGAPLPSPDSPPGLGHVFLQRPNAAGPHDPSIGLLRRMLMTLPAVLASPRPRPAPLTLQLNPTVCWNGNDDRQHAAPTPEQTTMPAPSRTALLARGGCLLHEDATHGSPQPHAKRPPTPSVRRRCSRPHPLHLQAAKLRRVPAPALQRVKGARQPPFPLSREGRGGSLLGKGGI